MRGIRMLAALLAVGGVLAAPASNAATRDKTSCDLIRDAVGDTHAVVPFPGEDDDSLDIVSGDIATTRSKLIAVIRLHGTTWSDASTKQVRVYDFQFTVNRQAFALDAIVAAGGPTFEAYTVYKADQAQSEPGSPSAEDANGIGAVDGQIDLKHKLVKFVAPMDLFRKYASFSQTYVTGLSVTTYRGVGVWNTATPLGTAQGGAANAESVDFAVSAAHYVPGAPNCLNPRP